MRPVYMISGGITKFAKAHPDKDFRLMVKEAFDYALADLPALQPGADRRHRLLLLLRPLHPPAQGRGHGPGLPGALPEAVPAYRGWRRHRRALLPVGLGGGRLGADGGLPGHGVRDHEPGQHLEGERVHRPRLGHQLRLPGGGLLHRLLRHDGAPPHASNSAPPWSRWPRWPSRTTATPSTIPTPRVPAMLTVEEVRSSPMVATPLTILDCCQMSDGAAVAILASEEMAAQAERPAGPDQRGGLRHRRHAHGRPSPRQGDPPPPRVRGGLPRPEISRGPLLPRRTEGGAARLPDGRDHEPCRRARLRRTPRCLHLVRDPDLRGPGALPLRRRGELCRLGCSLPAEHRLRSYLFR